MVPPLLGFSQSPDCPACLLRGHLALWGRWHLANSGSAWDFRVSIRVMGKYSVSTGEDEIPSSQLDLIQ